MFSLPYALARQFLFRLDPETAHTLALRALATVQDSALHRALSGDRVNDPIELGGLRFPNRVGLAAGLDKNARCIDGFGAMGFGFVEVGTVTPLAQPGNPKPRMFRLPQARALINRLGFNNEGLDAFVANIKRSAWYRQRQFGVPALGAPMLLGLNIGKNAITPIEHATDDYLLGLTGVYPYADYVTVNISSPNTNNLRTLQDDRALDGLLGALAQRREALATQVANTARDNAARTRRVPLFIKIAPDLNPEQVTTIAAALQRHGMDGVVATNTTLGRDAVRDQAHANEAGGLSGAPLLEPSNRIIAQLRSALGPQFPIIGVGGIMSAEDALGKIRAGADVVQLYTGLIYHGPALVSQVASMIDITLKRASLLRSEL